MTTRLTGPKLSVPQRMQVFALLARGDTTTQINAFLTEQYGIQLSYSYVSDMRKKHKETIDAMRSTIQQAEMIEAEALVRKSRRLLSRKLDKADRDMDTLEELDYQYANREISKKDYDNRRRGLVRVGIAELANVSKIMHDQTKAGTPPAPGAAPALPSGDTSNTEALLAAIKSGDTVELQRIILNPPAETPPV